MRDKIRQGTFEAYKLEKILMKKIIALAVATAISAPAMADLTIGASARYDARSTNGADFGVGTNRVLVSFAGSSTAESGMFVSTAATLQLIGGETNTADTDGDNAITIGNAAANVVLGAFEPAGAFSSGADAFELSAVAGYEGGLRAREHNNIGLNVTAVEGLTLQISTDIDSADDIRAVVGYDFGAAAVTAAYESVDAGDNGFTVTAGTTLGGVALNASYGKQGDVNSTNINASYMGFGIAVQNDDNAGAEEQEVYGTYAVSNVAGLEGLTATVGYGSTDVAGNDNTYGVRLDYAF